MYIYPFSKKGNMATLILPLSFHAVSARKPQIQLIQSNNNNRCFRVSAQSRETSMQQKTIEYRPGLLDEVFLKLFRKKMVQEVGWDSDKAGYDGLIDVVNRLMVAATTTTQTQQAAVRILRSLFPPLLLDLYKILIAPIAQGKLAAVMVARVTAVCCQWLMGSCTVNTVDLADGSSLASGVFVERCKYLEESKCVGICVHTCKLPTQTFFMEDMGVPLLMEPNFNDYSCQFKFGVSPPREGEEDSSLKEAYCLEACPNAIRREQRTTAAAAICPKAS